MKTKAGMTLTGLALGMVVLSGCTGGGSRQTTSGLNSSRGNTPMRGQEWTQQPVRQQGLASQPPVGNNPGQPYPTAGYPGVQPYPVQAPSPNLANPSNVPAGAQGNSFRNPLGISGTPNPGFNETTTPAGVDNRFSPGGPSLTPTPPPTFNPNVSPTGAVSPARPLQSSPYVPNSQPGFPQPANTPDNGQMPPPLPPGPSFR